MKITTPPRVDGKQKMIWEAQAKIDHIRKNNPKVEVVASLHCQGILKGNNRTNSKKKYH